MKHALNPRIARIDPDSPRWTRRAWMTRTAMAGLVMMPLARRQSRLRKTADVPRISDIANSADDREALARWAVDAAMQAGARYADTRLTHTVTHAYSFGTHNLGEDKEIVGVGVRALVNGYWGFAACPSGENADVEQLARDAVAQAEVNSDGAISRAVELGHIPAAIGSWATPVTIDPFTVSIEEKHETMRYWQECAKKIGLSIDPMTSGLQFTQQERVVVTSDGGRFTQTLTESGGVINLRGVEKGNTVPIANVLVPIQGIAPAGCGWELFLEAKIPEQIQAMPERVAMQAQLQQSARPMTIGRYTLVCDGATMAALLEATLGVGLQLDRALGYEANAGGTSFLDDPFAMLGVFRVAAPLVNITANRSASRQLATVKWDDEGVTPPTTQLVKGGILTDFQTTREQAAWLAPYYAKMGKPVHSNGCAAAENALGITMQHMPNLSLEPNPSPVRLEDLIADVKDGLLLERGTVGQIDAQARNGLLGLYEGAQYRQIKNGRLGSIVVGGAVSFNTLELWQHINGLGGISTQMTVPSSQHSERQNGRVLKGQPAQATSHTVKAVAATIPNQALIKPEGKA